MEFTVSEAARLYGKQRKQLYRHMESGRLSCRFRGDGKRVLDLSELMRCYGEPSRPLPKDDTETTQPVPLGDTVLWQAMLDELQALREEVKDLKRQMLRLPSPLHAPTPPESAKNHIKTEPPPALDGDDPHGFRAIIKSMREPKK